jgi:ATP-dependent Clp protease ATP-binding subunit ClpB
MSDGEVHLPAWAQEIDLLLPSCPQFVLSGNVKDHHGVCLLNEPGVLRVPTDAVIADVLLRAGYSSVLVYDIIDGLTPLSEATPGCGTQVVKALCEENLDSYDLQHLARILTSVAEEQDGVALIIRGASHLSPAMDASDPALHQLLNKAEKLLSTAKRCRRPGPHRAPLFNSIFWLTEQDNDLPGWFIGNPAVRVVSIPRPTLQQRQTVARELIGSAPGALQATQEQLQTAAEAFSAAASGLMVREMAEINRLAIDRGISYTRMEDAVRMYRVGVVNNPWQEEALRTKIRDGAQFLGEQVLGQPHAIRRSLDILIRSSMGLTGAQARGDSTRPQGVLFFAGPTGVGKTELAKSITELVFGRRDAFTRFDMSEFASEGADNRLIGSPVGYTGHTAGGELTNAVRQNPFQLILFDEIEKAHPLILDKFLQILEDGRLTDGNGVTVFFTETLIVFTSNLGVYVRDADGVRRPVVERGQPYPEVEANIQDAITHHFVTEIGRPELLNRLGENIVVFDYISDEAANEMIPLFLHNVTAQVRQHTGVELSIAPEVVELLREHAQHRLEFGGRGVATTVETVLVNPLSRALFALPDGVTAAEVRQVEKRSDGWAVLLDHA